MSLLTYNLRITTIVSRKWGGCIFNGTFIDPSSGLVTETGAYANVKVSPSVLGGFQPQVGMWVAVEGEATVERRQFDGIVRSAHVITAKGFTYLRPSGEHLIRFLADSEGFAGVGIARARRLWDRFGDDLYRILDEGQDSALLDLLPTDVAANLMRVWADVASSDVVRWLHDSNFPFQLARKVVRYFGREARVSIEEDPYRLLSFSASWKTTDTFARGQFGIGLDDPRRLLAACEEALYRAFNEGHTVVKLEELKGYLKSILSLPSTDNLVSMAIAVGECNGGYISLGGVLQTVGAAVLERGIAKAIVARLLRGTAATHSLTSIAATLDRFEVLEKVTLSDEQRAAVELVSTRFISCISGGAGVGKTTVLKAVLAVLDETGLPCRLLALAGRAAKRISEATGRPAQTIAGFIRNPELDALQNGIVVIDEASMVDILSMAQVLDLIPETCRVVLVGDSAQLMPVGPGLVFHILCGSIIPTVELKQARRFGAEIAHFANQIREGSFPEVAEDSKASVCLFDLSHPESIAEAIVELYDPVDCQILCSRRSGPSGTKSLNSLLQARVNPDGLPLMVFNREFDRQVNTGLRINDPVIYTRNNYRLNLRNGSLGKLSSIPEEPAIYCDEVGEPLGTVIAWVEWDDGVLRPVFEDMLSEIELAYAITTHKAQGSQWKRVLIPLVKTRNFDRSMLYTAVTRAQSQVILFGDRRVAVDAASGTPHSAKRRIHLGEYIIQEVQSSLKENK
ncbi:ATP-dependent RecD-like DNA helicase [Zoogloea sp. LCSB751]|uniref:ATP-dependent DNA helicase n=1 Tax=Zoogloea sp. LCSB751 TaxID=1965277 RepID=UPI0009A4C24B|nr:ATP-dependent RecD-like DNA helicase [Zoogloea sp. LCSB751]